jgi:hypothetical protein
MKMREVIPVANTDNDGLTVVIRVSQVGPAVRDQTRKWTATLKQAPASSRRDRSDGS